MKSPQIFLLLFNKPFQVLTQFTSPDAKTNLSAFLQAPDMRPAGRLDYDSEGLVLLTNSGLLQTRLADPRSRTSKVYYAQVEGALDDAALAVLRHGVMLNDGPALPAQAEVVDEPPWLWSRDPPIRYRRHIPSSWLRLAITEGRNRQVRRMTAAIGYPTLRLIRWSVGPWSAEGLAPGESRAISPEDIEAFLRRQ